jgi:RND family efflux transporter MFP subunit
MSFRTCLLLGLCSIVLTSCAPQGPAKSKQESGPVRVRVAPVTVREVQRDVESVGTLFPYEEVVISSEIDGRVEKVNADLGDRVSEGQVLVAVSEEEQRYLLAQNEAQLRQALERLGLKAETDRVQDIKETPDVRRAQADLFDAEQRYKRVRNLVEQQIGSRQDLDAAQARFQSAQAGYDTTMNQTRNLIQEVERTRAVVGLQRKRVRDTNIRSPFVAEVKERQVNVGQFVKNNTPVFTLVKIDPIRLRLECPERMAPWVKVGQVADVTLEAFPTSVFKGKIWRISPTVEQSKRTFVVEALIANPRGELKPGSYAKARIRTNKVDRIKLAPRLAITYIFGVNKAYVVKDGVINAREIKLGEPFDQEIEVTEGLEPGDQIAVTQLTRLDEGIKVTVSDGPPGEGRRGGKK